MVLFKQPITIANSDESTQIILKPPTLLTDRVIVLGSGVGLMNVLATLQ